MSIMNVAIFNGLTSDNLDAIEVEAKQMDKCLMEAGTKNRTMHVHSVSPCFKTTEEGGTFSITVKPGTCDETDVNCYPTDWTSSQLKGWVAKDGDHGGVFGIARDGHVIYGPYNANNELWSCEDVDLCNGFFHMDGSYGYATTTRFPYVVGCWGPGPAAVSGKYVHTFEPSCTSNGCPSDNALVSLSLQIASLVALVVLIVF